jgi:hypothetical protein
MSELFVQEFFSRLRRRWLSPPPERRADYAGIMQAYLDVQEALRTEERLRSLSMDIFPELRARSVRAGPAEAAGAAGAAGTAEALETRGPEWEAAELHAVEQMLQVMESAWLAARTDRLYGDLMTQGWMNVFHRWSASPIVRRHWLTLRGAYSKDFLRFCEDELNLGPGHVRVELVGEGAAALSAPLDLVLQELEREWPQESIANRLRALSVATAAPPAGSVWLIFVTPRPAAPLTAPGCVVCGLIGSFPTALTVELFVWVRGPYRNLGIGRAAVRYVLEPLWQELSTRASGSKFSMWTRYPGGNKAHVPESARLASWLNFFYYYDFRKPETDSEDLVMERQSRYVEWRRQLQHTSGSTPASHSP